MDRDLDVELVGRPEAGVDRGRRGPPVLVQLQPGGAGPDLLRERLDRGGVPFPEECEIERPRLGGLQHAREVPRPRRAGRGGRPGGRAGPASDHGGDSVGERFVDLLRRDEVNVAVDRARRDDQVLACHDLGGGAHHQLRIDPGHDVGIACLPDLHDAPIPDPDVGLDDSPVIDDQRVGDDEIERARGSFAQRPARLAHAVADHLPAAKGDLIAGDREIFLDLDDQFGVGQPHAVTGRGAVEVGVGAPWNLKAHRASPLSAALERGR